MRALSIICLCVLMATCSRAPTLLEEVRLMGALRVVTRESPTTYYQGPLGPMGPEYELVKGFAQFLGVELDIFQANQFNNLLSRVETGRAHLAAAGLTVTEERARRV